MNNSNVSPIKLCINCKYHEKNWDYHYGQMENYCISPCHNHISFVDGVEHMREITCEDCRSPEGKCAPRGILFEQKQ